EGRIGLAGFEKFSHGKVVMKGTEVKAGKWDDAVPQVKNWFVPFPNAGRPQRSPKLAKAPNGDLLCVFDIGKGRGRVLGRSTDSGRTWTAEPAPKNLFGDLQLLRDGRLVSISLTHGEGSWAESKDNGKTWSNVTPVKTTGTWPKDPAKIGTGWQLALK